jgi:hypothetical protein
MNEVTTATNGESTVEKDAIPLKLFLENTHPSKSETVSEAWGSVKYSANSIYKRIITQDIRIHCKKCEGERTFRSKSDLQVESSRVSLSGNLRYLCGDCHETTKDYYIWIKFDDGGTGIAYKYGELPPFGVPVPNRVLRIFGKDADVFLKGRQCENLGYGVGAFAYYRRVVETHKNDILDEIIKVCRTVNAPDDIIEELNQAKDEVSFSKAVSKIKAALPQGLLINGHNPLLALHGALSVGLHDESDEACLEAAHAVRLVLIDLVEKLSTLRQDNTKLNDAVQLLLKKKG